MSIQAHRQGLSRRWSAGASNPPPGDSRECLGMTAYGTQCMGYATRVVPEVQFCGIHLPHDLVPVAVARSEAWLETWSEWGPLLWADVVNRYPMPS